MLLFRLGSVQKLQNCAARIAASNPYNESSQPILKALGWLTVGELIEMETARMVYWEMNKEASSYLTTLFERLSDISVRELRNTDTDLGLPRLKTSSCQQCFAYRGAQLWNNLRAEVRTGSILSHFKAAYNSSK